MTKDKGFDVRGEAILRFQGRDVPVVIDSITESPFEATRLECWVRDFQHITFDYSESRLPKITNVIFNDPATIVFWADGTKTVVKCQDGDIYNPEVGLAMAISKKALGNQGNYANVFKKWLPEERPSAPEFITRTELDKCIEKLRERLVGKVIR